jgi:hypothetical protein
MSAISDLGLHPDGHLVIRQVADLPDVLRLKRQIRRLELALPGLDAGERAAAEVRLAARLGACGCTEGAIGLLVALPVVSWLMVAGPLGPFMRLGVCVSVVVVGALLGKAVGMIRARTALQIEVTRIQSQLKA